MKVSARLTNEDIACMRAVVDDARQKKARGEAWQEDFAAVFDPDFMEWLVDFLDKRRKDYWTEEGE